MIKIKALRRITVIIMIIVSFSVFAVCLTGQMFVPDEMYAFKGEKPELCRTPFIRLKIDEEQAVEALNKGKGYTAWASLCGVIPIKEISINFTEREDVILCGTPIGIKLHTDGIVVSETTNVASAGGNVNPGKDCGLLAGDVIISINGRKAENVEQLIDIVSNSAGNEITLTVVRENGKRKILKLKPVYSAADGRYRAGIWIRNSTAGIGMLTFCDEESKVFGGLGHAICDESTGTIVDISSGEITDVMLTETVKGVSGAPGELVGFLGDTEYGTLTKNTESGIYGYMDELPEGKICEIALKQEIKEGKAQLMTSVPGAEGACFYDIEIEKINYDKDNLTRNMIIHVTDERLINLTGGIVQGMSGSPIVQNGRLIGAATHVLVNDPTRGYGIFIENMLEAAS